MKALWTAGRNGLTPFVSNQVHYSLQTRDIENEIIPVAVDQGIGILVWSG
jgi:aryl-alcohol dehydrogenase-like predicted oxidoreductase